MLSLGSDDSGSWRILKIPFALPWKVELIIEKLERVNSLIITNIFFEHVNSKIYQYLCNSCPSVKYLSLFTQS